ncbi:MAG: TrmO family methyltransferase domain-containing protein [Nocardioidaceae bacterium]
MATVSIRIVHAATSWPPSLETTRPVPSWACSVRGPRPDRTQWGLHRVSVLDIRDGKVRVRPLEAINGTPLMDIKPVIRSNDE